MNLIDTQWKEDYWHVQATSRTIIIVQGIYEIFKADLKLIATELLLSPNGR